MSDRPAQLTIPLHQQTLHAFDNYYPGPNSELLALLKALATEPSTAAAPEAGSHRVPLGLWLWAEPGSGRSHLLQASCQAVERRGGRALYLPLALLPRQPEVLDSLQADLIALDDVDAWLPDLALETALMALYQGQLAARCRLLYAARRSAQRTDFALADLASRLRALPGFQVLEPDDAGLREVLSRAAHRQGLELSPSVLDFWLHRSTRSLPLLLEQLEQLDARALSEQRRVTIPLIKEVLAL